MYKITITEREAGQRLDKYLHRILPNATTGKRTAVKKLPQETV